MRTLHVKGSQPQHTDAGRLLGQMYYGGFLDRVLDRSERSGYPHNGGEHTLHLELSAADFLAFVEIVRDTFAGHPGVNAFLTTLQQNAVRQNPWAHLVLSHKAQGLSWDEVRQAA